MLQQQGTINIEEEEEKKQAQQVWGKLISQNEEKQKSHELKLNSITIGRSDSNDIAIPDKRLSSNHCRIIKEGTDYFLQDLSTNGTFLADEKIGKGNKIKLNDGDKFYLLHKTKVQESDIIGYTFQIGNNPLRRKQSDNSKKITEMMQKQQKAQNNFF